MNKLKYTALVFVALLFACTQNNGHIGDLFGSWSLNFMSVDNKEEILPEDSYTTFSFQSNIVMVTLSDGPEQMRKCFGTWSKDGNRLFLDFTHHSSDSPEGTGGYMAPVWLGFPASGKFELTIATLDGSSMDLVWEDQEGKTRVFKFNKTW